MTPPPPVRVLIVDDHPVVRAGLRALIEAETDLEVAGEAANAAEARAVCADRRPDVAVLDLRLPDGDGVALGAELAARTPRLATLILSSYAGDEDIHRAFDAGMGGYVMKEAAAEQLVAALRAVVAGRRHMPVEVAERALRHGPRLKLTAREQDVLEGLAEGLRNKQIGARLGVSEATVRSHVEHLLTKFGCRDRGRAVALGAARGFLTPRRLAGSPD